jgi:hypothetical protein
VIIPDSQPKSYVLVHQDGTQEVVYLNEAPVKGIASLKDHLMISYVVVGTVALALTAYLTYLQLKKM